MGLFLPWNCSIRQPNHNVAGYLQPSMGKTLGNQAGVYMSLVQEVLMLHWAQPNVAREIVIYPTRWSTEWEQAPLQCCSSSNNSTSDIELPLSLVDPIKDHSTWQRSNARMLIIFMFSEVYKKKDLMKRKKRIDQQQDTIKYTRIITAPLQEPLPAEKCTADPQWSMLCTRTSQ